MNCVSSDHGSSFAFFFFLYVPIFSCFYPLQERLLAVLYLNLTFRSLVSLISYILCVLVCLLKSSPYLLFCSHASVMAIYKNCKNLQELIFSDHFFKAAYSCFIQAYFMRNFFECTILPPVLSPFLSVVLFSFLDRFPNVCCLWFSINILG